MPSSVKNKLMNKNNIDQLDELDSIIDDFIDDTTFIDINGNEFKDEYDDDNDFYSIVNNYDDENSSTICECNIENSDNFHYKIKTRESHTSFYSNICYFLSYLDFTKQIR